MRWWFSDAILGSEGPPGYSRSLPAAGDGAAGHHADEMCAVFRTGVDVGVEPVLRDRDVLDRVRGEGAPECGLHLGDAEHARAGTGDGNAHARGSAGDKDADDRIARGRVPEFLIAGSLRLGQPDRGDDLGAVE